MEKVAPFGAAILILLLTIPPGHAGPRRKRSAVTVSQIGTESPRREAEASPVAPD